MKQTLLFLTILFFSFYKVQANNVAITNVVATDANFLTFDIAWDNSWYVSGGNWDAVWVFVKAQDCSGTDSWDHKNLSSVQTDHTVTGGTGLYVEPAATGAPGGQCFGVFIRRNSNGSGTQSGTIALKYAASIAGFATVNFHVVGVEMVWVPQGSFYVGDGTNAGGQSTYSLGNGGSTAAYNITSENAVGADGFQNGYSSTTRHTAVPAAFPKGYDAFYCMKYEISQKQYVTFLNDLSLTQQSNRVAVSPTSAAGTLAMTTAGNQNRSSIVIKTPSASSAPAVFDNDLNLNAAYGDGADLACNFLSFNDLKAYLDWAALRPMTELEYEKASRGTLAVALMEYPWGNTTILSATSTALTNPGTTSEVSTASGTGLCAYNKGASTTEGPLRCGFAATASTVRVSAGASYYGIMDMGGNVWEQAYSVGWYNSGTGVRFPASHIFTGNVGDGVLSAAGDNSDATWNVPISEGVVVRGGNWENGAAYVQTSDRSFLTTDTEHLTRVRRTGGRGVRKP